MKNKPDYVKKLYGDKIDVSKMVSSFQIVPIIEVPGFGNLAAVKACNDLKIKSPKERILLDEAKELVYTKGFYEGKMIVGEHKGMLVKEAKPLIRQKLIGKKIISFYFLRILFFIYFILLFFVFIIFLLFFFIFYLFYFIIFFYL